MILGAGGHGKVVIAAAVAAGIRISAVLDDNPELWGTTLLGLPVDGPLSRAADSDGLVVIALGDNQLRSRVAATMNLRWGTIIHPASYVHPSAVIGTGSVIMAGAVVQPDARIGRHTIVNTAASVDHDCCLGDFAHIGPGARLGGEVTVDEGVLMGVASAAKPGVRIGAWSVVGAGSVVISNLPPGVTAVGVPARVVRKRESEK